MTKYLLGAAGVALLAATGAAQAADVMPVIVPPIVTPVVVAPAGPTITFTADNSLVFAKDAGDPLDTFFLFSTELGVETASGLGFTISTDGGYNLVPFGAGFDLSARVYKKFANVEVGAFIDTPVVNSLDPLDAGFDFSFTRGIVTVENVTTFFFVPGGAFLNETTVTLDPSDMVSVYGLFGVGGSAGIIGFELGAGASLTLGAFSPYADVLWTSGIGFSADVGVDFEKALGNSPLSLIANAEAGLFPGGGYVTGSVGIRFALGGE